MNGCPPLTAIFCLTITFWVYTFDFTLPSLNCNDFLPIRISLLPLSKDCGAFALDSFIGVADVFDLALLLRASDRYASSSLDLTRPIFLLILLFGKT